MKQNLYFQHSDGSYRLLLENCTENEAWRKADEFMSEHNFKCYYIRSWKDNEQNTWWDVGSHTEFFAWGFLNIQQKYTSPSSNVWRFCYIDIYSQMMQYNNEQYKIIGEDNE